MTLRNEISCKQLMKTIMIHEFFCRKYVTTCSGGETGNKSGRDKFLIK